MIVKHEKWHGLVALIVSEVQYIWECDVTIISDIRETAIGPIDFGFTRMHPGGWVRQS